jgi:methanethiol S-methyltransferase
MLSARRVTPDKRTNGGFKPMSKTIAFIFGLVSYLVFFFTFLYAIGFVGNLVVPKSIDSGTVESFAVSLVINLVLLCIFAIQHSVMARPGFKRWWTKFVPESVERSVYVLLASLALLLLFWQWRPMPDVIWSVENRVGYFILEAVFFAGWLIVLLSTFMINHFDLFGLRQVYLHQRGEKPEDLGFRTPAFYKLVRHPIMVGFLIAFWAAPVMTAGHLLFAVVTTAYILVAVQLEERDLTRAHGETYEKYRSRVGMFLPLPKKG